MMKIQAVRFKHYSSVLGSFRNIRPSTELRHWHPPHPSRKPGFEIKDCSSHTIVLQVILPRNYLKRKDEKKGSGRREKNKHQRKILNIKFLPKPISTTNTRYNQQSVYNYSLTNNSHWISSIRVLSFWTQRHYVLQK